RPRQRPHARQRPSPLRLHVRLPRVPAPGGGRARLLLVRAGRSRATPAVARGDRPQHQARPLGVGQPVLGGGHRHLHPSPARGDSARPTVGGLNAEYETVETDVLVLGAGGAGLRGAIAAAEQGAKVLIVCKSLLGKAHTVMAEGGMAAALANVAHGDSWEAHFADTMKGGKLIN